jgi:hypothetical protein
MAKVGLQLTDLRLHLRPVMGTRKEARASAWSSQVINEESSPMRILLGLAAALTLGTTAVFAAGDSFSAPEVYQEAAADYPPARPMSLYERIAAHYGPMGRNVREEFRDGPCRIERKWERDGDYEERIKCKGPRH